MDTTGNSGTSASSALPAVRTLEYQINALGGIDGRPVQFVERDDKGVVDEDDTLVDLMNEFVEMGALGVVGPINSGQVRKASEITSGSMVLISPGATAVTLSELNTAGDPWILRTVPNDGQQVRAMLRFAKERPEGACSRMAVAYLDDGVYGAGLEAGLKSGAAAQGITFAGSVSLPTISKLDYTSEVERLAAMTPDCLVLVCYDDVGGPFAVSLTNARNANSTLFPASFFVIGSDGLRANGFLDKSKGGGQVSKATGFYGTAPDPNPPDNPSLSEFLSLRRFLPNFQNPLDPFAASAYDAAALLVLGRARAGSDDPIAVRDAVLEMASGGRPISPATLANPLTDRSSDLDYRGASGDVDFLPGGDVVSGFEVWTVKDGKFDDVAHYPGSDFK